MVLGVPATLVSCPYCPKRSLKGSKGLNGHISRTQRCRQARYRHLLIQSVRKQPAHHHDKEDKRSDNYPGDTTRMQLTIQDHRRSTMSLQPTSSARLQNSDQLSKHVEAEGPVSTGSQWKRTNQTYEILNN